MTPPTPTTRRQAFTTAGLAMFGASLATSTRAAESPAAPSSHHLDVRAFGAKGDGTMDDTAAFQTALNQAYQTGGGIVFVPPGRYLIATHLSVPHNVTLEGIFTAPPTTPWRNDNPEGTAQLAGSVLLAIEGAGKAFIHETHDNHEIHAYFPVFSTHRASLVPIRRPRLFSGTCPPWLHAHHAAEYQGCGHHPTPW